MVLIHDGRVQQEPDVIVGFKSNNIGEEVTSGHGEIFDNKVNGIVSVFDSQNEYVCSQPENMRHQQMF